MKKLILLVFVTISMFLLAGCDQLTGKSGTPADAAGNTDSGSVASDNYYNTLAFKEGWWQCEFTRGKGIIVDGKEVRRMWNKYNTEKISTKCRIRYFGEMSLDFLDITDTLDSTKQWYNWDTMKEFVKKTGVDSFRFDVNVTD